MGFGGSGGSIAGVAKKVLQQQQPVEQPKADAADPLSPESVALRQRVAQKLRETSGEDFGIKNADGTASMRGLDIPQVDQPTQVAPDAPDAPHTPRTGAGAQQPDPADQGDPYLPYQNPKTTDQQQANDRYTKNKQYRSRTGKDPDDDRPLMLGGN